MDNLRRALSLRWCRMANREYAALVVELREVIGIQAEQLTDLREMVKVQRLISRDVAAFALDICPEDSEHHEGLERITRKLRDHVALTEEHEL